MNNQQSAVAKMALAAISALILMFTALAVNTQAAPMFNVPMTVSQPDGTTLDAFISGDEFFNYLHDSEGRVIVQHPETGFWVYAMLDASGVLTASSRVAVNNGRFYDADSRVRGIQPISSYGIIASDINFALNSHLVRDMEVLVEIAPSGERGIEPASSELGMVRVNPISGTIENVVVLITFACDPNPIIDPSLSGAIEDRFNAPQSSLRSYMYAASGGMLTLNSTLVGMNNNTIIMYQDTQLRGYFMPYNSVTNPIGYDPDTISIPGASNITQGHIRGQQLLARAIAAIDGSTLLDGKVLNTISPSRVDSVTFVLTGDPGVWASFLWPHRWTLHLSPATINGVPVNDYSLLMLGADSPAYPFLSRSTIVHEQLHIFGMPDFYRYASTTRPPGPVGVPVGGWDIMAHGSEARFQFSNTHAMRRYIGWGDPPVTITESGTFTLHPRGTPNQITAFAIPVQGRPNEFILLEYRSNMNPTVYDNFLASDANFRAGLVISRINTGFRGNARSGDPAFQGGDASFRDEVYIFRPGTTVRNAGLSDVALASLSVNSGRTSFGDALGTGYNGIIYTQEGYNTGIEIYNVSVAGSTISFNVYMGESNITSLSPEMALRAAVSAAGSTPTVIYLTQDIVLSEVQAPLTIPSGRSVILRGEGGVTRTISAGGNFAVINVGANEFEQTAYLVLDGVDIARAPGTSGRGISVLRTGHLTLTCGIIAGHNNGAIDNAGTFVMNGGEISNNTATGAFAGGVTNMMNFAMTGGTIYGNTGAFAGGVRNSPVNINNVRYYGTFIMSGGTISSNTATGPNGGGGVSNNAIFNMSNGEIAGNVASRGGGVTNMNSSGTFTMTGGTISSNTALTFNGGAGVLNMSDSTFIMEGGLITNNTAHVTGAWGGGVGNGATFIMRGGVISNNSAWGSGGGVAVTGSGTFNMEAGTISGNIANGGGGIGMPMSILRNGQLNIGAAAIFTDNDLFNWASARGRNPADDALYALHIHAIQWSDPFNQGLNTFDISSDGGWIFVRPLNFMLNGTAANPTTPESIGEIRGFWNYPLVEFPRFPADPTRVGYVFAGWFTDPGLTQPLTPAIRMQDRTNTRLYARWVAGASHDITVNVQGSGTATASVSAASIGTVVNLTAAAGGGYRFVEWQVVSGGVVLSSTADASATFTMPDNDVVVRAVFEVVTHMVTFLHMDWQWICCCTINEMLSDQWATEWENHWISSSGWPVHVINVAQGHPLGNVIFDAYPYVFTPWRDVVTGVYYCLYDLQTMLIHESRVFIHIPMHRVTFLTLEGDEWICCCTISEMLSDQWIVQWETHWTTLQGWVQQVISVAPGHPFGDVGYYYPFVHKWRDAISGVYYYHHSLQTLMTHESRIFIHVPPPSAPTATFLVFEPYGRWCCCSPCRSTLSEMLPDMLSDSWAAQWQAHWATQDGWVHRVITVPYGYSFDMLGFSCCCQFGLQSIQQTVGARVVDWGWVDLVSGSWYHPSMLPPMHIYESRVFIFAKWTWWL